MDSSKLYISHESALHYWRTNPPQYVLDGASRNIRVLRDCPASNAQIRKFNLSETEFGKSPIDVLVPAGAPRPKSILKYHVQKAPLPPHSIYPLYDGIHIVSPALCFVQLCAKLPFTEALELGMELCGTYALRPEGVEEKASRNYQLASASGLKLKVNTWKDMHGLAKARKVTQYLENKAASPMESKLYLLLCLPLQYGGYNFERPEINAKVFLKPEGRLILRQELVKPDFLWRSKKLVLEYDGGYHNDPYQRVRDEKRRAVLESMGYTVAVAKKQQIYDPIAFDGLAHMLRRKLGLRSRSLTVKHQLAREALRETLLANTKNPRESFYEVL